MKCPLCAGEMQAGTVRVEAVSIRGVIWSNGLYFSQEDGTELKMVPEAATRLAHRCAKCNAVVLLDCPPWPLPEKPVWGVCIAEQQQGKGSRQAVYDCLLEHKIPHALASATAREFHHGLLAKLLLHDSAQARGIADSLRALGLEAAIIEPDGTSGRDAN